MDEKRQFAERLKAAMKAAGYEPRPNVLEREFNLIYPGRPLSYQAVRRWLIGLSVPEQDKLQLLAEWLGVEAHVLRYGGKLKVRETAVSPWGRMDPRDRAAFHIYLGLPPRARKAVREMIAALADPEA